MPSDGDTVWICANCGRRHDTNDPPCRSCAGETFARLDNPETGRIESTADVIWVCQDCGETAPRNGTPCRNCGGFDYEPRQQTGGSTSTPETSERTPPSTPGSEPRTITLRLIVAYLFAGIMAMAALGAIIAGAVAASVCWTASAVVSAPHVRRRVTGLANVRFSTPVVVVVALVLYFVGAYLAAPYLL